MNELDVINNEIEKVTYLLNELAIVLSNCQPEAVGKLRLVFCKTSANNKRKSFIFQQRDFDSAKRKKYQKQIPQKNILLRLNKRWGFEPCHSIARETLQLIVSLNEYREKLIKKESETIVSINNLLRPNKTKLTKAESSARKLDDQVYENLKSRDLESYYNHTDF